MRFQLLGGPQDGREDIAHHSFTMGKALGGYYVINGKFTKSGRVILEWMSNKEHSDRALKLVETLKLEMKKK